MKRKFYEGQVINNKVVKTVWSDSSNHMIKKTNMKELIKRWNSPTPKFWKKVQKNGLALSILGGVIVKFQPLIGGIIISVGSTISALAQLTVED